MKQVERWMIQSLFTRSPEGLRFGFAYSANPYRGCAHACRYCYARETHTYLGHGVGEDFETRLYVKAGVERRAQNELARIPLSSVIAIGTATDPYQPLEGRYRVTRSILEALAASGHPFTITTKSPLILRDLDLLRPLAARGQVVVHISLVHLDPRLLRRLEPGAPPPRARLKAMERLCQAKVPVTHFLAPVLPGLTDHPDHLRALLTAVRQTGVRRVMAAPLRVPPALRPYLFAQLKALSPRLASAYQAMFADSGVAPAAWHRALEETVAGLCEELDLSLSPQRPRPHHLREQVKFPF